MTKRPRQTAEEFLAELQADPAYQEAQRHRDAARQERARLLAEAERPLVAALRRAGLAVQSVWDLVNTTNVSARALPILLEHLLQSYPGVIREGVARALAVPEARTVWAQLRQAYVTEVDSEVKDALAVALSAAAGREQMQELLSLVEDSGNGDSRIMFLGRIAAEMPERLPALTEDPVLRKEARFLTRVKQRQKRRAKDDRVP